MTMVDHSRRLAVLLLALTVVFWVPSMASATFTAVRTPTLVVGTDRMEMPTSVTGTYRCAFPFFTEGVDVSVKSFSDSGPAGATYDYTITGRKVVETESSPNRHASLSSGGVSNDLSATEWTLTIRSRIGSWTGPAYTHTISCPATRSSSGSL